MYLPATLIAYLYPALFMFSIILGMWITEKGSTSPILARKTYLAGVLSGIAGARIWYSAQYGFSASGFSYYGFGFGAALGVAIFHRWYHHKWAATDFLDAAAPALALGSAIHRLGCFFTGCCFGKACSLPWAVVYSPGSRAFRSQVEEGLITSNSPGTLPIHPTQLYESALLLIAFFATLTIRRRVPGLLRYELFLGLAVYYSVARFLLEFIRDDAGGLTLGPLTFSQGSAAATIALCGFFLIQRRVRYRDGERHLALGSAATGIQPGQPMR